jgi:hypothetical protein
LRSSGGIHAAGIDLLLRALLHQDWQSRGLSRLVLVGEAGLRRTLREFVAHYHEERNHQGKDNVLLFPSANLSSPPESDAIECKQRLGGMLKHYYREAA